MRNLTLTTLALMLLMIGCNNSSEDTEKELIKPIKYGVVESFGGLTTRTFNGITQSGSETNLSFRTGGLVTQLNVSVGARVTRGQLLAQLDQTDALLALEQAELDVANAEVQLQTATSTFDRIKLLYETNSASLSDYDQAKSTLSNAQSSYEIALRRLDLQRSQLSYTSLSSPMDGIVSSVNVERNEVVRAGQSILTMSQENAQDIEAQAGVPERYISQVTQGSQATIRIPTLNADFEGVITELGYNSSGGTYPVITSMNNTTSDVRPGMPVEVTFTFGNEDQQSQLIVPIKAVGEDENGAYVYRLNLEDEVYVASKASVEIGSLISGGFIVRSGLEENQIVATAGLRSLYDGMKVTLLNE